MRSKRPSIRLPVTVSMLAIGLLAPLALRAQQPALRTSSTAIVVDVVVRDKHDKIVSDLRAEDFEIFEDGVRQDIADATFVGPGLGSLTDPTARAFATAPAPATPPAPATLPAPATPPALATLPAPATLPATLPSAAANDKPGSAPPRPAPNAFRAPNCAAVIFDRLSPEARALAYKGALAFVADMQPGDIAGVFISGNVSLQMIQPYTADKAQLHAAMTKAASRAAFPLTRDDIQSTEEQALQAGYPDNNPSVPNVASAESIGRGVPRHGQSIDEAAAAAISLDRSVQNSWEVLSRDHQGHATMNALLSVITALSSVPGRKSVIFFAEGLAIPPAVQPQFERVVAEANRGNVSVYTVDAAGLRVHSEDEATAHEIGAIGAKGVMLGADGSNQNSLAFMERNEDVLRKDPRTSLTLLAKQTGGFLIENRNDLAKGLGIIDADRRAYYLLTYAPKNTRMDGKWRAITVKVPKRPVQIRARTGYLAKP